MPDINPYVGEFVRRASPLRSGEAFRPTGFYSRPQVAAPALLNGGVGVRTPTFQAYCQESEFGIAECGAGSSIKNKSSTNIKTAPYVFACFKEISEFLMLLSGGGSTLLTHRLSMNLSWLFRSSALIDLSKCQNISALVTSYKIRAFEGRH
jgi:hypothetical protein